MKPSPLGELPTDLPSFGHEQDANIPEMPIAVSLGFAVATLAVVTITSLPATRGRRPHAGSLPLSGRGW